MERGRFYVSSLSSLPGPEKGKRMMAMQEYIKNEDGLIPVTSVRQLIYLGNRHNSFISDTLFGKIDEILKRIPHGSVTLFRNRDTFKERWSVKIQIIKPEWCGIDDRSIRLLKGDPDKMREISRSDEMALAQFLQEQGYNEEHLGDFNNEVCARYFVRTILKIQPIQ